MLAVGDRQGSSELKRLLEYATRQLVDERALALNDRAHTQVDRQRDQRVERKSASEEGPDPQRVPFLGLLRRSHPFPLVCVSECGTLIEGAALPPKLRDTLVPDASTWQTNE